jgi:diaminopimelate epimerase
VTSRRFWKYEGTANDFIIVESDDPTADLDEGTVARICDRRRGVGGDGVLLVTPGPAGTDARMVVRNADGSRPEMCGNGARCVALHVATRGSRLIGEGQVILETDAGPKRCRVEPDPRSELRQGHVTVDMGRVTVGESIVVESHGRPVSLTRADAGNPHAVTFDPLGDDELDMLGARLQPGSAEQSPLAQQFPRGVNLERARVSGEGGVIRIHVVVYERGVGRTLACGTGACAVAAVAVARGVAKIGKEIGVALPGGILEITLDEQGRASMRGPARCVFEGTLGDPVLRASRER